MSVADGWKLGKAIHGFEENVFLIAHEPFADDHWKAVQRAAEHEGFGFEVCAIGELKAIKGGKA